MTSHGQNVKGPFSARIPPMDQLPQYDWAEFDYAKIKGLDPGGHTLKLER
jgi:hypothetical protein